MGKPQNVERCCMAGWHCTADLLMVRDKRSPEERGVPGGQGGSMVARRCLAAALVCATAKRKSSEHSTLLAELN
jgi:hypothetical protein